MALLNACGGDEDTATPSESSTATGDTSPSSTSASTVPSSTSASTVPSSTSASTATSVVRGPMRKVNLGFIALTDAASIIMAKELGYFEEFGIDATVLKQASWPAFRDGMLAGDVDGGHCLYSMPFSVATKIGGPGTTDLKLAMILNNNGQAITLAQSYADVGYGDLAKAKELLESDVAPELAMTFPGGTHDLWLRYWLKATGADTSNLVINPVPPPQMVQNMEVGNVRGYCVGEPWNAVAVTKGIGFTHLATQDLWLNHPEKALVVNAKTAADTELVSDMVAAVLKASAWLDEPANRSAAADTLGQEQYVNAPAADIRGRLTGVYDLGAGLGTKDFAGDQMQFHRGGLTNPPRRSYGYWALAQYQRLGLLQEAPDYAALCDEIILTDVYAAGAEKAGVEIPDDDMAPFDVVLDGATFDPAQPDKEAARP
jgi:nitrate/nitrite transport system substrate-binding protein